MSEVRPVPYALTMTATILKEDPNVGKRPSELPAVRQQEAVDSLTSPLEAVTPT